ncbi:zinc finger protein 692 [Brachyhypopomus gauderio]|uniref:zinc finger protein 692 n=1 Tax=Brachyhypopomus gauderio TaxID=698409 RepID=UPI004042D2E7
MSSAKDALRRQRRRELDARRSRSRVRLGSCLQGWAELKDELGFSLHSELAQFLLQSYLSKECSRCSGGGRSVLPAAVSTTEASLHQLVLLVHSHGRHCSLPPSRAGPGPAVTGPPAGACRRRRADADPEVSTRVSDVEACLNYTCERGHGFTWHPTQAEVEGKVGGEKGGGKRRGQHGEAPPTRKKRSREQGRRRGKEGKTVCVQQEVEVCDAGGGSRRGIKSISPPTEEETEDILPQSSAEEEESERHEQDVGSQEEGSDAVVSISPQKKRSLIVGTEDCENTGDENQSPDESTNISAVPISTKRGSQRRANRSEQNKGDLRTARRNNRQQPVKDDVSQISGKKKRKATPKLILPCEFEGCWKIFSSRQYLNHHMKYQHVHQKTFSCPHASCGKSFNFKKHLKEHEKLHSDQRDYICEFCARAFRTSSNLSIHRRIHTGEKPLQCEVCGFTCRQKASLNWHMRKHDAERGYQFPCDICGRRFEKRDNVTAHRSKSHPEAPPPARLCHTPISSTPAPSTSEPRPQDREGVLQTTQPMTLDTFASKGNP